MLRLALWVLCFELGADFKELVGCVALMMLLGAPFAKGLIGKRVILDYDFGMAKMKETKVDAMSTARVLDLYGVSLATLAKAAIYKGLNYKA